MRVIKIVEVLKCKKKMTKKIEYFCLFSTRFTARWNFHHCLGALDGKHIAIRKPDNAPDYRNYKGFYSIILMGMCDANYRFRYIEVGDPGGSSDAGLYNVSPNASRL